MESMNTSGNNIEKQSPYTNFINRFSFFNNKVQNDKKGENSTMITAVDTERGVDLNKTSIEMQNSSKCPFKNSEVNANADVNKNDKVNHEPSSNKDKCPYTNTTKPPVEEDEEDENKEMQGGCPVMNNSRKDPPNKHFEPTYEIPRFGQFDFMFFMQGGLEQEEFLEKTKMLRSFPRHMKYTLFYQNQEKLAKVHEAEFPRVFFLYDDIKEKGNRMFRRKKCREAIEHYTYAYGLLKWIQFKDKKRQEEFLKKPSLEAILDSDIEEKKVYLDDVQVEEDSYKACVVFLLMNLSYIYMELRHYSEAVDCLDECEAIAEDLVPDVFFRRSQARSYNKSSTGEELSKAMADIDRAIRVLKKDENLQIYKEHKEILSKIIEKKISEKFEATKCLIVKAKKSYDRIKANKLNPDEVVFTKSKDAMTQYKILKEMKSKYNLAIKFFTEAKNEEQLDLSYKEIERFMTTFNKFKFYANFSSQNVNDDVLKQLADEEKCLFEDVTFIKLIDEFKFKLCEDIFGEGDFNFELFQYSMEKIFDEERKQQEEEEKIALANKPRITFYQSVKNSSFLKYFSGAMIVASIGTMGVHYYLYSSSAFNSLFK